MKITTLFTRPVAWAAVIALAAIIGYLCFQYGRPVYNEDLARVPNYHTFGLKTTNETPTTETATNKQGFTAGVFSGNLVVTNR